MWWRQRLPAFKEIGKPLMSLRRSRSIRTDNSSQTCPPPCGGFFYAPRRAREPARISHSLGTVVTGPDEMGGLETLQSEYPVEAWQGNLATGRFELGALARHTTHGIAGDRPCGLGPILGAYESASCPRVAYIMCATARNGGQFSSVSRASGSRIRPPVSFFAAGETRLSADGRTGQIRGVFLLPRLAVERAAG